MRVDPSANVKAFTRLADTSGTVATEVGVSVMKQAMDAAESQMAQLLQSMQPHLGKNVDLSL
jgi:hypothetical protein